MLLALLLASACTVANVLADDYDNRWPAKREYADPAITAAMESVRAAIPKAADDPARPIYHFRPPARWTNEPCGVIHHKGYYHVFYQLNPTGATWGVNNTHWGHTRSKDLIHWEHLPVALYPSRDLGERRCNSGCVVINGKGQPMIFYTYVPQKGRTSRQQWAAIGDDDLITWKKLAGNPVIDREEAGVPATVSLNWSDPFVFRADGKTFVTFKDSGGTVCQALTEELTRWKYVGSLGRVPGECPNFVKLGEKWLLITSAGRSTQQLCYQVGMFDSQQGQFKANKSGILDHGYGPKWPSAFSRGFYATNTLIDPQGRCILFGWVGGFKGDRGWNGCHGLPRILTLGADGRPRQTPVPERKALRGKRVRAEKLTLRDSGLVVKGARGDALEILARFQPGDAAAFGLKVRRSDDGSRAVTLRYDGAVLDVAGTKVPFKLDKGQDTLTLHVFLDKSLMEVFVNDGREAVTRVIDPGRKDLGVEVFAEDGTATVRGIDVWTMKAIWPH